MPKPIDGDEELRRIHAELGPRWKHNDPRFSEDLPYWMMKTGVAAGGGYNFQSKT